MNNNTHRGTQLSSAQLSSAQLSSAQLSSAQLSSRACVRAYLSSARSRACVRTPEHSSGYNQFQHSQRLPRVIVDDGVEAVSLFLPNNFSLRRLRAASPAGRLPGAAQFNFSFLISHFSFDLVLRGTLKLGPSDRTKAQPACCRTTVPMPETHVFLGHHPSVLLCRSS